MPPDRLSAYDSNCESDASAECWHDGELDSDLVIPRRSVGALKMAQRGDSRPRPAPRTETSREAGMIRAADRPQTHDLTAEADLHRDLARHRIPLRTSGGLKHKQRT